MEGGVRDCGWMRRHVMERLHGKEAEREKERERDNSYFFIIFLFSLSQDAIEAMRVTDSLRGQVL